ncbi:hypothetical protein ONZ45_g6739 [Pleurotus djamor]|nr:hypothetical protein ONZ45_g6739 [Pleurotus djamor]
MTTAYSAFFASGLLATSFYAPGNEYTATKTTQYRVDVEPRLAIKTLSGSSSLNRCNLNQWSPSTNSDVSPTSSPLSVSRHRRRRSSLSAAVSMTLTGVKPSPRDATAAATRSFTLGPSSPLPQRRTNNSGSLDSSPNAIAHTADSDVPKRSRTLRRSTISSALAPLRLKRSDRRGPSPAPPPSSPLPPVPPLPSVSSAAQ